MNFLSSKELSEKWGIGQRRIILLAREGRIPGAKLYGKTWVFPENAQKPADGRTRACKNENQIKTDTFRYPIFEFKDISSFHPPLSKEELTVKAVIEAFNACRFDDANRLLGDMPEKATNKYIRITAIYCGCMVSLVSCDTGRFIDLYGKLKAELAEDFPYKAEMSEYVHEIEASLGMDKYYSEDFHTKPAYLYHESFLPRLCNLSTLRLALGNRRISPEELNAAEIYCGFLEKTDHVFDLQVVHLNLACAYSMLDKTEESNDHFVKALKLAEKYEMFYTIATMKYYYMPASLEKALHGFPEKFKAEIKNHIRDLNKRHIAFTNAIPFNNLYKLLVGSDYLYIVFAVQGLNHKEVADRMHVSVGNVGKRYSQIYNHLGIQDKKELIAFYHKLTDRNADK